MSSMFIVGESYCNRDGNYSVIRIVDANKMEVQYTDGKRVGEEATLEMRGQEKLIRKMEREQNQLFPNPVPEYFMLVGYLSVRARFEAEVPVASSASFEKRYLDVTKQPAVIGSHYWRLDKDVDKWSCELRIYSKRTLNAAVFGGSSVELKDATNPKEFRINNNKLWWQLVLIGFRLGTCHDLACIRSIIPPVHLASFDAGTILPTL